MNACHHGIEVSIMSIATQCTIQLTKRLGSHSFRELLNFYFSNGSISNKRKRVLICTPYKRTAQIELFFYIGYHIFLIAFR